MNSFFLLSGSNLLRQGLFFLGQIYLFRILGKSAFGEVAFALSIYFILAGFSDLGTRFYYWKNVLDSDPERRLKTAVRFWIQRGILLFLEVCAINVFISLLYKGVEADLIRLFSVGLIFNHAAFDWYFLSIDRIQKLFLMNLLVGVSNLLLIVLFIKREDDILYVPAFFVLAFVFGGLSLMLPDFISTRRESLKSLDIREALTAPMKSYRLGIYEIVQRTYSGFLFVVTWIFYEKGFIGELRVYYLFYTLITAASVSLSSTMFNRIFANRGSREKENLLGAGLIVLLFLVIPISVNGNFIADNLIRLFHFQGITVFNLSLYLWVLVIPAIANFFREALIPLGKTWLSTASYAVTIVLTTLLVALYHPASQTYVALILIIGELLGLIVAFYKHTFSSVGHMALMQPAFGLISTATVIGVIYFLIRDTYAYFLVIAAVYLCYLVYLKNRLVLVK